jgi:hypothetical protein
VSERTVIVCNVCGYRPCKHFRCRYCEPGCQTCAVDALLGLCGAAALIVIGGLIVFILASAPRLP